MNKFSFLKNNSADFFEQFFRDFKNLIKTDKSLSFTTMKDFCNDPLAFCKSFVSSPHEIYNKIQAFILKNEITVESIFTFLLAFIFGYMIFKFVQIEVFRVSDASFFKKKIVSYAYFVIWIILIFLARGNALEMDNFSRKNLPFCIILSIIFSFLCIIILAFMPIFLIISPVLLGILSLVLCQCTDFLPSKQQKNGFFIFLFILTAIGFLMQFYFKYHIKELKRALALLIKNSIPLILFIISISVPIYAMVRCTVILRKECEFNSISYVFLWLMDAWAHFMGSYLITVFTSSLLSSGQAGNADIGSGKTSKVDLTSVDASGVKLKSQSGLSVFGRTVRALKLCLDSLDFILICSLFASILQLAVNTVDAFYSTTKGYSNLFMQIISKILFLILKILKFILIFVESTNSIEMTKLGVFGIEKYFARKEEGKKEDSKIDDWHFFRSLMLTLEGCPHILVSITPQALFSVISVSFLNICSNGVVFTIFVCGNLIIYILKGLLIAHQVISIQDEKRDR